MNNVEAALKAMHTHNGHVVYDLSFEQKVMLIFLRHFGCTFCREALKEISQLESKIAELNTTIVMVHMSSEEIAQTYFTRYNLERIERVSDPECKLYKAFGILKGTFNQLFGFRSWLRGIDAGIIKGHGWGGQLGDGFQMPGVFTIYQGKILAEFRHKYASDKPNYLEMAACVAT